MARVVWRKEGISRAREGGAEKKKHMPKLRNRMCTSYHKKRERPSGRIPTEK